MPAVRRPVQLLGAAERLRGQLVEIVGAQDVDGTFRRNRPVDQGGDIGPGDIRHPVVPVAVHQVLRRVGLGLVESRVAVRRGLEGGVLDAAHVQDLLLIRGDLVVADPVGDVAELDLLAEFAALERGLPELPALQEIDALAVGRPARGADALGVARQLDLAGTVRIAEEQVAAAAVLRYGGIGYAVEDLAAVGGELGVGQAAERKERLGRHHAVCDLDVGRTDVAAVFFLLCTTDCHNQTGECNDDSFHDILL